MKPKQEQIKEMANAVVHSAVASKAKIDDKVAINLNEFVKNLYNLGYRKASDVIDGFVGRINLIECEMFHKAHDVRNSCEYKIDHGNTDDRVWGDKRACDGKMVALQDFMTKIEKLADEMRKEVEK